MTNEKFLIFLNDNFGEQIDYLKIKPIIMNSNGIIVATIAYFSSVTNEFYIALQSNAYEAHIEEAIKAFDLSEKEALSYIFNLVSRQGTEGAYTSEKVKAKYHSISIKIDKLKNNKIEEFSYSKTSDTRWQNGFIALTSKCLYRDLDDCDQNFKMLKLFVNSLKKKHAKRKDPDTLKSIYKDLGMNEQTFFSWKKKNPKAFQALIDGHFYNEIKEIIDCIVTFPDIQRETWNTDEPMKYMDGTEF